MDAATQNAAGNDQLMSFEQARNLLNEKVTIPVFFHKLASVYGLQPRTENQRQQMVRIAAKLLASESVGMDKRASDESDVLTRIESALDQQLGHHAGSLSDMEKAAADSMLHDPELREAAYVINEVLRKS